MALQTLPDISPDYNGSKSVEFQTRTAQFGDGYTQRSPEGINNSDENTALTWSNLPKTDADTLENFFKDHKGSTAFLYTLPQSSTEEKFICKSYTRTPNDYDAVTMTATFTKVYDL